ncbi:ATP-grasp domain-containing protein [Candidatus Woesearchaeota archaeon]|nr:ATP-grasp domain-containing protein [Candidatus Woesearchaeota archaeon]
MKVAIVYSDGEQTTLNGADDYKGRNDDTNLKNVEEAIKSLNHEVIKLNADEKIFSKLLELKDQIDIIYNLAEEGYSLDIHTEPHMAALFEMLGFKFTGSNYLCLANCLDKIRAKQLFVVNGLSTPNFMIFNKEITTDVKINGLKFPLIVKPGKSDGSIGIRRNSVVENSEQLVMKVNEVIQTYEQPALVEEFIDGREVNVAILGNKRLTVLPMSEIIFDLPEEDWNFVPYEAKWLTKTKYYKGTTPKCPAEIEPALKEEIEELAKKAYTLMGVRGYGRVDFRIDANNKPYILEVNPNPDISRDAGLARMISVHGMTYEDLIEKILRMGVNKDEQDIRILI